MNSDSFNKTQLDRLEIQPKLAQIKTKPTQEKKLLNVSHWLWLLAILIVIIERVLAFYRKQ